MSRAAQHWPVSKPLRKTPNRWVPSTPSLEDTYRSRCHSRACRIVKDTTHPSHHLFTLRETLQRPETLPPQAEDHTADPALLPPRVTETRADSCSDALIYRWTGVIFSCASVPLKLWPPNQTGEVPLPILVANHKPSCLKQIPPSMFWMDGQPPPGCTGGSFSSERTAAAPF